MTWHQQHLDDRSPGDRAADKVATFMGSWKFIVIQSVIVVVWMTANTIGFIDHWDIYPFVLLNLVFSTQAAYAAPIIMMAQNRASERDRANAQHDYDVNVQSREELRLLHELLDEHGEILKEIRQCHQELNGVTKSIPTTSPPHTTT